MAFYLIGQCLATLANAVVVIDEPELHLHQSIQARLWDQIEAARPDCVFVYITHDLSFAASRATARKVWVRSYDGAHWDWEEIAPTDQFPESLTLQILGSRRPILFVEGDESSLDLAVYRALFPERLVLPRQSCERVVQAVATLRSLPHMHHTNACGIIDRDRRSDEEIATYVQHGVVAPDLAEVENLLLLPEVIRAASKKLERNPDADFDAVRRFLLNELRAEFRTQVSEWATFRLRQRLGSFSATTGRFENEPAFSTAVSAHLTAINPENIYREAETLFTTILDAGDYASLIKNYNRKSLVERVSPYVGLAAKEYPKFILRLLLSPESTTLRQQILAHIPSLA